MEAEISKQIAQLPTLSRQERLDLWQKLHRRAAPEGIRKEIMVPCLAYRIQEIAYGGLSASTRAELRGIARKLEKGTTGTKITIHPEIKSGTRIIRPWRGETHEVLVTESGYEYKGTRFKSLSQIARKITGTKWSGPLFFGLKKRNCLK